MLKSLDLAVVDVETTGSSAVYDRVIEVGVLRVSQGRLVGTYGTLINPERPIPPIITQITGISDKDVAAAPAFNDVAFRIKECLRGCVFVAHNVRFDYSFLRNEFERAGIVFSADCLCSVRLSRLLYPRHRRHSLSALIERFEFPCKNRHRALDDAAVVWAFLQHAQKTLPADKVENAARQLLRKPLLPPRINREAIDLLPSGPGVYVFYDESQAPLYVGKSIDVRDRVLRHFAAAPEGKDARLCERTVRIEAHRAYGELGAALLALRLMKKRAQARNRRLRRAPKRARWPFPGAVAVEEKHYSAAEGHVFIIDQWRLVKALRYDEQGLSCWLSGEPSADGQDYKLFAGYLATHPRNVRSLTQAETAQLLDEAEHAQTTNG